jgi:hypothetical protein
MKLSVEEWTAGMDERRLRACIARFEEDEVALRARVAELEAMCETLRNEIAQYWEPLVLRIAQNS